MSKQRRYEIWNNCLTLGACKNITAADTHPITTEEIIMTLSKTCEAARHSSCHSIICFHDGCLFSGVVSLRGVSLPRLDGFLLMETPLQFVDGWLACSSSSALHVRLSLRTLMDVTVTFWFCSKASVLPPNITFPSERLKVSNVGL